jgi:tetratricopeptide (TPR) repeat protein
MRTKWIVLLCCASLSVSLLRALPQSDSGRQQQIDSHNRKAAEYLKESKPELAISELRAVIALDNNNVDARGNLGVLLFFQADYTNAIPQLRAALKLKPTLWKIQALLGIGEKRVGEISAAQRDLEEAFPKVPDKKIRIESGMELIEIYSGSNKVDKAAAVVAELRKVDATNENILYTSYRLYSDLAAESMLSLSLVDPNSARMHQAMAHELAKRGDTAGAIENYRAAIKIDPKLPGIHFELAEMLSTLSTEEGRQEAEREYKTALEINPFDEQSESRLGDIALQQDDLKQANERYSRAVQLQPNDPDADIGLAKVFMTMDQPLKAEPLLQRALKLDPTSPLAHFRLSTVYRQIGRTEDAKRELEEYQKYKAIKDELRTIYHGLHQQQGADENESRDVKK